MAMCASATIPRVYEEAATISMYSYDPTDTDKAVHMEGPTRGGKSPRESEGPSGTALDEFRSGKGIGITCPSRTAVK